MTTAGRGGAGAVLRGGAGRGAGTVDAAALRRSSPTPPTSPRRGGPRRRRRAPARWRGVVAPALGGWRGATALAACAALGFWLGLAGGVTLDGTTLQAGTTLATADDGADPVEALFELAAVE